MKNPFQQSLKDCGVGLLVATIITAVGGSIQSPQARMGVKEILILGFCCAIVIAVVGLPISYFARRSFARSALITSPLIFGAIGFFLSQTILIVIVLVFLLMNGGNALEATINILYLREWRFLTAAFAVAGAVIGALSLIKKEAE